MANRMNTPEKNRKTARTAVRMVLYPTLGMTLLVVLFFAPQVRETYFANRWRQAITPAQKRDYFASLVATHPSRERLGSYLKQRTLELVKDEDWHTIHLWLDRGYGSQMHPVLSGELMRLVEAKTVNPKLLVAFFQRDTPVKHYRQVLLKGDREPTHRWLRKAGGHSNEHIVHFKYSMTYAKLSDPVAKNFILSVDEDQDLIVNASAGVVNVFK